MARKSKTDMGDYRREGAYDVARYDSIGALVACATDRGRVAECNMEIYARIATRCSDFTNGYSLDRAVSELSDPPRCAARVRELAEGLALHDAPMGRRLARRREDGDEMDAGAWVRRETDGWSRMERTRRVPRVLRIAVNVSSHCEMTPDMLFWRGAAACALADALESRGGDRAEVVAYTAGTGRFVRNGGATEIAEVMVKRAESPMDADGMALVLGELGFYRTAFFAALIAGAGAREVHRNLGSSQTMPPEFRAGYDIVIDNDITSETAARALIARYAQGFDAAGCAD